MRTIAHISDLHFGRIDPPVLEGLAADLESRKPTLLVVSGDFTQRARPGQYRDAAAFMRRLPKPQLVVPGNHDIPMFDVVRRFFFPLGNYTKHITRDLRPCYQDEELFVLGINTARSFTHKSGWISEEQLLDVKLRVCPLPEDVVRVVVTHHPFVPPPREPDADVIVRGESYIDELEACGVDLLLAGHLHLAYHDDLRSHYKSAKRSILSIQSRHRDQHPPARGAQRLQLDHGQPGSLHGGRPRVGRGQGGASPSRSSRLSARSTAPWRRETQVPVDKAAEDVLSGVGTEADAKAGSPDGPPVEAVKAGVPLESRPRDSSDAAHPADAAAPGDGG